MSEFFGTKQAQRCFESLARSGNIAMLERHESLGRPILCPCAGRYGVHFGASHGRADVVQWFLERGVDVDVVNCDGLTFGLVAAKRGFFDILRLFLDRGGDRESLQRFGMNSLQMCIFLGQPDSDILKLVDHCCDQRARLGSSIGDLDLISGTTSLFGFQAIHFAAHSGRLNILRALISAGADPNASSQFKCTPFLLAAQCGHEDVMRFLFAHGADVNCQNILGENAAHIAACQGNTGILTCLDSMSVDMHCLDKIRRSIITCAIQANQVECCRWMVEEGGFHCLLIASPGRNLRAAFRTHNIDFVRYLSLQGAVERNCTLFACQMFHAGLLDVCLEFGFSFEPGLRLALRCIEAQDWDAFDWLVAHGFFSWPHTAFNMFDISIEREALIELKRRGYDFAVRNNNSQTLFFVPIIWSLREFLVMEGLDPNAVDICGNAAFDCGFDEHNLPFFVVIGAYPESVPFQSFRYFDSFLSMGILPINLSIFDYQQSRHEAASLRVLAMHAIGEHDEALITRIYDQYPLALWAAALVFPGGVETLMQFEIEIDFDHLRNVLAEQGLTYLAFRCREESSRLPLLTE